METCLAAHGGTVAEGEQGLPDLSMELPTRSHSPSLASLPGLSKDLKAAPVLLTCPLAMPSVVVAATGPHLWGSSQAGPPTP